MPPAPKRVWLPVSRARRTGTVPLIRNRAPCGSNGGFEPEISKSTGWGGARANSGGARRGAGRPRKPPVVALPPAPDGLRWYCVRTVRGEERTADTELRLADFAVFAPSLFKPATQSRRDSRGVVRPGRPDRVVPLFPRYLFVQFNRGEQGWRRIRSLPGVERIMGAAPERPLVVPDAAIAALRALCSANDCVYPPGWELGCRRPSERQRMPPLAVNARARVLGGPFADLDGVCTWSDGRRVKLLLSFLGRPLLVEAAQDAVAVLAA